MIELGADQIRILGRPNFTCREIVHRLKDLGLYEVESKSESEQAVTIHFLLGQYNKHGDSWLEEANKILKGDDHER